MSPISSVAQASVVVASTNPVKLDAAARGFARMFPSWSIATSSVSAASGVGHQPMTDEETLVGAERRARSARASRPAAHFWVGIEGGVEERAGWLAAFAWVVVLAERGIGRGRTGTFFLPEAVARLVREGMELGTADDRVFGRVDSKRETGAVGLLTGGVIDRTELYEQAVVLALIPFRHSTLYALSEAD